MSKSLFQQKFPLGPTLTMKINVEHMIAVDGWHFKLAFSDLDVIDIESDLTSIIIAQ